MKIRIIPSRIVSGFVLVSCLIAGATVVMHPASPVHAQQSAAPDSAELFAKVKPILVERCSTCHGVEEARSGLRVDSREALLRGGKRGPAIVPGEPGKSLLVQAVLQTGPLKMPRRGKLTQEQIEALEQWIHAGAPWPETK